MSNEIIRTLTNATLISPTISGTTPRIVSFPFTHITSNFSSTSTTFVDITGLTTSVTAVAGDTLFIDIGMSLNVASTTGGVSRMLINDGGTDFNPGPMAAFDDAALSTNGRWYNLTCGWTVLTSGTVTVKAQIHTSGGVNVTVYGTATSTTATNSVQSSSHIRILHMRNA